MPLHISTEVADSLEQALLTCQSLADTERRATKARLEKQHRALLSKLDTVLSTTACLSRIRGSLSPDANKPFDLFLKATELKAKIGGWSGRFRPPSRLPPSPLRGYGGRVAATSELIVSVSQTFACPLG